MKHIKGSYAYRNWTIVVKSQLLFQTSRSWNSRMVIQLASLIAHTSTGLKVVWLTCVICHTFDSALCIIIYLTCIKSVTSQGKIYQNKVGELKAHVIDVLRCKIHCSNTFLCPEGIDPHRWPKGSKLWEREWENSSLRMAEWISLWELPIEMVSFNTPIWNHWWLGLPLEWPGLNPWTFSLIWLQTYNSTLGQHEHA